MCTPPLSAVVRTKSSMWRTCGSLPSTGSSWAVPGAARERIALPATCAVNRPAPSSQSASSACWRSACCLTSRPSTSQIDSFSAPDSRLFLTADGDAGYPLGNGTIMVHPEHGWLELKLPAPLAHLANRPHGRYRLSCSVRFSYRADQWAAQVASGVVRYDLGYQPERDRWYLDASWTHPRRPVPTQAELAGFRRVAVDLNASHLDCMVPSDRHRGS